MTKLRVIVAAERLNIKPTASGSLPPRATARDNSRQSYCLDCSLLSQVRSCFVTWDQQRTTGNLATLEI